MPFPSPGDLPNPRIEPGSPALQADSLRTDRTEAPSFRRKPHKSFQSTQLFILCLPKELLSQQGSDDKYPQQLTHNPKTNSPSLSSKKRMGEPRGRQVEKWNKKGRVNETKFPHHGYISYWNLIPWHSKLLEGEAERAKTAVVEKKKKNGYCLTLGQMSLLVVQ